MQRQPRKKSRQKIQAGSTALQSAWRARIWKRSTSCSDGCTMKVDTYSMEPTSTSILTRFSLPANPLNSFSNGIFSFQKKAPPDGWEEAGTTSTIYDNGIRKSVFTSLYMVV